MIKCDCGTVQIRGPRMLLHVELSVLIKCMIDKGFMSLDEFESVLTTSLMSDEAIEQKGKEAQSRIGKEVMDSLWESLFGSRRPSDET